MTEFPLLCLNFLSSYFCNICFLMLYMPSTLLLAPKEVKGELWKLNTTSREANAQFCIAKKWTTSALQVRRCWKLTFSIPRFFFFWIKIGVDKRKLYCQEGCNYRSFSGNSWYRWQRSHTYSWSMGRTTVLPWAWAWYINV